MIEFSLHQKMICFVSVASVYGIRIQTLH